MSDPKEDTFEIKLATYQLISKRDIIEELRLLADSMSTHKALATKIGISPAFLSDILHGKRDPGSKVCKFLKVEPILVYKEISNE